MKKILTYIRNKISKIGLFFHRKFNRNKNITIISRDCIGGVIYNQYGLKFLSPTINLYFIPTEFNLFCLNLHQYIDSDLVANPNNKESFPVGILKPKSLDLKEIKIYFMHYNSFEEAQRKWEERKQRIQWDNIFVISNVTNPGDSATCSPELIADFNKIPYKKVIFVDKKYGFDNEYLLKRPKNHSIAWVLLPSSKLCTWKKMINKFNFNKFFRR